MIDFRLPALHRSYRQGMTPAGVIAAVYSRIEAAADPGIFITLRSAHDVLSDANDLGSFDPQAKPLWGVPFAVKDNIDVAGLPTTAACPGFAYVPKTTSRAVQRLLDAGALLIGKTNLDQFATGLAGVRTPYPIPKNAMSDGLIPGGSSSGSAVATARAIVTFALGTDTAGSGRVPAALNNIVGLKPSLGLVSTSGVVPACRTLDSVSVLALTVDDAWAVLTEIAAFDAPDPYSRPAALSWPDLSPFLRIGIPSSETIEFYGDKQAEASFAAGVTALGAMGFGVREIDFGPFKEAASLLYAGPWVAERYQAIRAFFDQSPEMLHPVTRAIIGGAARFSAADAFAGFYRLAGIRRTAEAIWREIEVLAVPSVPTVYTREEIEKDPIALNSNLGTYTNFVNLLDLCALAVPFKFRNDGLPSGITLIAPRGGDGMLAALGRELHMAANVPLGATQIYPAYEHRPATAPPGWIELAVVGAHLSGLPLNGELQTLGAVLLRKVRTAPHYKLFALSSGTVPKPGLLRVPENSGSEIECEVWALSPQSFGRFVAAIPAPLGVGTLLLADGTSPKGFLAEAQGVEGCRDISHWGGWRNYIAGIIQERKSC
jgi:allophanate hydrolase